MYNWGSLNNHGPMGPHRCFSTYTKKAANDNMYAKVQNPNPLHQFAQRLLDIPNTKKFSNPNFVNEHTSNPGILYEKCSMFINDSNGYPNNLPKTHIETNCTTAEPMPSPVKSSPVDIVHDLKQHKPGGKSPKNKHYLKKPKARKTWHKQSLSMEMLVEDIDEVGIDVCNDPNYLSTSDSSYCDGVKVEMIEHPDWKPTFDEFIRSPKTTAIKSEEYIFKLPHSPICIKISTPLSFSISPPKPLSRNRIPSDCVSEDSFVIFDDGDSSCSEEDDEFSDTDDSDDEFECFDFNDNSCKNTPKTDIEDILHKKKVRFADGKKLAQVHPMIAWSYAYQESRKGHWEEYARDRERFHRRIETCEKDIKKVLNPLHRLKIFNDRFNKTTSS